MSLTTVAELRTALGVGTLYADATLQEVCDAADNVLLPFIWNNNSFNISHSNTASTGTLYFDEIVNKTFYVGQTVVIYRQRFKAQRLKDNHRSRRVLNHLRYYWQQQHSSS